MASLRYPPATYGFILSYNWRFPTTLGHLRTFGTPVDQADAIKLTHYAIDHGVNLIDTANIYEGYTRYIGSPDGVVEEILGCFQLCCPTDCRNLEDLP
ncbi:MAG: aldo/keto reductase [Spirochaetia bacterium]